MATHSSCGVTSYTLVFGTLSVVVIAMRRER
jgi:hypothetical protein